jgi:CRISPR-associated exonuclease Cas4
VATPWELRAAPIVFAENVFRLDGVVSITATVDRVYRNASGLLVLVELKTRKASVSHWSDVIELSAQRVAVMGQTGRAVAKHAYVLTETPTGRRSGWHRVELISAEALTSMALRRESLLRGGHSHLGQQYKACAEIFDADGDLSTGPSAA